MKNLLCFGAVIGLSFFGCEEKKEETSDKEHPKKIIEVPAFNADSAYFFIHKQVDFGPRIPNTKAHGQAGDYFIEMLNRYGAKVTVQSFTAPSYGGERLFLKNIIASYSPDKKKRILLAAHWDTRPFADKDPDNPHMTFDGANDGASGVGVLLEVARLLNKHALPKVGVDIVLFDGEDWGQPENASESPPPEGWETWWCLGSQYWSGHKHQANYSAYYGILLDMVGARDSQFFMEGTSREYAPSVVRKVWDIAARLGYSDFFLKRDAHAIIDDHLFMNKNAGIPTINIVHYQAGLGFFGDYHHSRKDNMDLISTEVLEVVGSTLMHTLYYEN